MANNYFSFKQFTVVQENAAMKVCTDSCLFGAWAAKKMKQYIPSAENVLDIGTGTGLLSLMVAQESSVFIYAIEVDKAAAQQATDNFIASPWKDRLSVTNEPVQLLQEGSYDFIVSNPPFYEDDLRSPDRERNIAFHNDGLSFEELINAINKHLSNDGYATVLLPFARSGYFETAAVRKRLHVIERVYVRQSSRHNYFRCMLLLSPFKPAAEVETEITIKQDDQQYSAEFVDLLKDFYLNLKSG